MNKRTYKLGGDEVEIPRRKPFRLKFKVSEDQLEDIMFFIYWVASSGMTYHFVKLETGDHNLMTFIMCLALGWALGPVIVGYYVISFLIHFQMPF